MGKTKVIELNNERYSPHLNLAETFWRQAKYEWLRPADDGSFAEFKRKVKHISNNIGLE